MLRPYCVFLFVLLLFAPRTNAAAVKEQLAVMDLKAQYGVDQGLGSALASEVRGAIFRLGQHEELSPEDVETIVQRTATQQRLGCDDNNQCLIWG